MSASINKNAQPERPQPERPQPLPPSPRQLAIEIERFNKRAREPGLRPTELNSIHIDLVQRTDLYHLATGVPYKRIYDVQPSEKRALSDLFNNLNGFNWSKKFGWIGQPKTMTKPDIKVFEAEAALFDGISASETTEGNSSVFGINFEGIGCNGKISEEIQSLKQCRSINMNYNTISNSLPATLKSLENLEYLLLSGNLLNGSLDIASLQQLTKLRELDLSFNQLTGGIPDMFATASRITQLNFAGNKLTGPLPNSMSNLINLKSLKLYGNELDGDLPDWLQNLEQLVEVNLSRNKLTGSFQSLCHCIRLRKLTLSYNKINREIPPIISQLTKLDVLYLDNNNLSGLIPLEIGALTQLQFLNLSNNNLFGKIPEEFSNLFNLQVCLLSQNYIIGPAPKNISNLKKLKDFNIFTSFPSEALSYTRAFNTASFERVYSWGPSIGIDSVYWQSKEDEQSFISKNERKLELESGGQSVASRSRNTSRSASISSSIGTF